MSQSAEPGGRWALWPAPPWRLSLVGAKAHQPRSSAHAAVWPSQGGGCWPGEGVFFEERVLRQPSALAHRI